MADFMKLEEIEQILQENFAPWLLQLNLKPKSVTEDGLALTLLENPELARTGNIICGQAIAAVADTAGVLAITAHNGRLRPVTTVEMSNHFLRPLFTGDVKVNATILTNGKRMATVRIEFRTPGKSKISSTASCVYAYLD